MYDLCLVFREARNCYLNLHKVAIQPFIVLSKNMSTNCDKTFTDHNIFIENYGVEMNVSNDVLSLKKLNNDIKDLYVPMCLKSMHTIRSPMT